MPKKQSRSARWLDACTRAQEAFDKTREAAEDMIQPLQDLEDIRLEFEEWRDNLPENLQQSALGEKLEVVVDLDFQSIIDGPLEMLSEAEETISNAEGAELPLGFGRD